MKRPAKRKQSLHPDMPLRHSDHPRAMTRRDFIRQGFQAGGAVVAGAGLFSLFAAPMAAKASLSSDLEALKASCGIAVQGAGRIPFICFDLAGGANIAGSNVLTGGRGGQLEFLSTAGYSKLGLPGDQVPSVTNPVTDTNDFVDTSLGLAFHSDAAYLRGILEKASPGTVAATNGAVIPARSENDTGNNPHNPMYAINRAGADGSLLTLIGSRSSDSGGNSMAPAGLMDPSKRPTKVDRPSDVTGLVDVGDLIGLLSQKDAVAVMESIQRLSDMKLNQVSAHITRDDVIKDLVRCGYVKSADLADRFGDPGAQHREIEPENVCAVLTFSIDDFNSYSVFGKTASVMKLVVNGFAGAGCITMGGFDYHTGERGTGERRDLRAGRCMGACLEYAARVGVPLMLYVFSDGSVASNGRIDDSMDGRGKGEWTGDNQSTASAFFLVYNPAGRPQLLGGSPDMQARHQQLGWFRADGSVETGSSPAANNVNLLVQTVALNYLALHGEQGSFANLFPGHGLGNSVMQDSLTAFAPIVSGTIS